eukprot:scaffold600_cov279-Pinguiococcus_pyrenoidosus.AAC.3
MSCHQFAAIVSSDCEAWCHHNAGRYRTSPGFNTTRTEGQKGASTSLDGSRAARGLSHRDGHRRPIIGMISAPRRIREMLWTMPTFPVPLLRDHVPPRRTTSETSHRSNALGKQGSCQGRQQIEDLPTRSPTCENRELSLVVPFQHAHLLALEDAIEVLIGVFVHGRDRVLIADPQVECVQRHSKAFSRFQAQALGWLATAMCISPRPLERRTQGNLFR